jgi:hypothetical protein
MTSRIGGLPSIFYRPPGRKWRFGDSPMTDPKMPGDSLGLVDIGLLPDCRWPLPGGVLISIHLVKGWLSDGVSGARTSGRLRPGEGSKTNHSDINY